MGYLKRMVSCHCYYSRIFSKGLVDDDYRALRKGCFKYFQLGGKCIDDPVSLLSGSVLFRRSTLDLLTDRTARRLSPSPLLLSSHFFAVILYAIWVVFTHPRDISPLSADDDKHIYDAPSPEEYPRLTLKGIRMVCTFLSNLEIILLTRCANSFLKHAVCSCPFFGARYDGGLRANLFRTPSLPIRDSRMKALYLYLRTRYPEWLPQIDRYLIIYKPTAIYLNCSNTCSI